MQSNGYADLLKRLNEYRKLLPMTEEEVANFLQISEKHYMEYEDGTKQIPCEVLSKLQESGWDMNYIVAGIADTKKTDLRDKLTVARQIDEKELLLLFSWIFTNRIPFGIFTPQECKEIKLLEIIAKNYEAYHQERQSVVQIVRETMLQSQIKMAERMQVCVKTYRKIEKEIARSSANYLIQFCDLSGYRPSLFITSYAEWDIIEHLWERLEKEDQKQILHLVANGIALMGSKRETL